MRAVLLVALLALAPAVPTAAACPEGDPCNPPPMPLCPTTPDPEGPKPHGQVIEWLRCWLL